MHTYIHAYVQTVRLCVCEFTDVRHIEKHGCTNSSGLKPVGSPVKGEPVPVIGAINTAAMDKGSEELLLENRDVMQLNRCLRWSQSKIGRGSIAPCWYPSISATVAAGFSIGNQHGCEELLQLAPFTLDLKLLRTERYGSAATNSKSGLCAC